MQLSLNYKLVLSFALLIIFINNTLSAPMSSEQRQFFESEVRPVLSENCYSCHSTKAKKLKGGLFLDHGSTILRGGDSGPAVVAGDLDESLIIEAVRYEDPDAAMPPKKKLADKQIKALEKWVMMGAPWPVEPLPELNNKSLGPKEFNLQKRKSEHWCWQPVQETPLPKVVNTDWSSEPIDIHILAKLEEKNLKPSPSANKNVLLRRIYFDLIGMPPTKAEVEEFVSDQSDNAYEKVVDKLLASPHFGERWARHWMDLVRYAETCGHEFDYPIPYATDYRDYLIRAFNNDVPYNQFTMEHIAGDLIKSPRINKDEKYNESVIGTGFWHFHEATHAPTNVRENESDRVDNQIDVFSKTFLGVTVSCARCHDHMFDAISTKDYYALAGYLQSSRRQEAFLDPHNKIKLALNEADVVRKKIEDSSLTKFKENVTPEIIARYLLASKDAISGKDKQAVSKEYEVSLKVLDEWIKCLKEPIIKDPEHPLFVWSQFIDKPNELTPVLFKKEMSVISRRIADQHRQHLESTKDSVKFADFSKADLRKNGWFTSGDSFTDSSSMPGDWSQAQNDFVIPGRANGGLNGGKMQGVLRSPTFTIQHNQIHHRLAARKGGLQIRLIIDGYYMEPYNGLLFGGTRVNDPNTDGNNNWISQGRDIKMYKGHKAHLEFIDHGDGYFDVDEIWFSDGGAPKPSASAIAFKISSNEKIQSLKDLAVAYGWIWKKSIEMKESDRDEDVNKILAWGVRCGLTDTDSEINDSKKKLSEILAKVPSPKRVQALTDGTGENEYVFLRGNHERLGDEVPRRFLTALGGEKFDAPENGSGRLKMAEQVVDPNNPLTSRVIVNRLWHHVFGRGIVASTDDFGVLGQAPSNLPLLDHLAKSFVDDGWSIKRMLKRLMMTKVYQQSSSVVASASEVDPENILLHRANLRRIQSEVIRDSILKVSGRLDDNIFHNGSVPVHVTDFMTGRGRPRGGPLDGAGKRSIYISIKRNFLSPMMLAFDMPSPFSTMGKRTVSNVPAQALIMMNDPFVHEQSGIWAKKFESTNQSVQEIISQMYYESLSRPPSEDEIKQALSFLGEKPDSNTLTDFAHVLFNTKEFIFLR